MSSLGKLRKFLLAIFLLLLAIIPFFLTQKDHTNARAAQTMRKAVTATQHYLYVFPDGSVNVYDIDNNFHLVKSINLPILTGGRGAAVDPASNMLYLSYNGDGGAHGNGSMLKYNLLTDSIVWTKTIPSASTACLSPLMAKRSTCQTENVHMTEHGIFLMPAMEV